MRCHQVSGEHDSPLDEARHARRGDLRAAESVARAVIGSRVGPGGLGSILRGRHSGSGALVLLF
jgi:hypothetical protein